MKRHIIESWMLIVLFESLVRSQDLSALYQSVRKQKVCRVPCHTRTPSEALCHSMDLACVLYIKQVKCLQHSAATTLLLRRHGWSAEMVIGAQMLPFKPHAW